MHFPALYTVAIYYNGKLQQFYTDQSTGNIGSSAGTAVTFETNGTPNFNQTLQNLVQGSNILIVTDNLGNTVISSTTPPPSPPVTFETNGTPNFDQTLQNLVQGTGILIVTDNFGNTTISGASSPPPAPGPVAVVQQYAAISGSGVNFSGPFSSNVTAGDLIIVCMSMNGPGALGAPLISDSQGNAYQSLTDFQVVTVPSTYTVGAFIAVATAFVTGPLIVYATLPSSYTPYEFVAYDMNHPVSPTLNALRNIGFGAGQNSASISPITSADFGVFITSSTNPPHNPQSEGWSLAVGSTISFYFKNLGLGNAQLTGSGF